MEQLKHIKFEFKTTNQKKNSIKTVASKPRNKKSGSNIFNLLINARIQTELIKNR